MHKERVKRRYITDIILGEKRNKRKGKTVGAGTEAGGGGGGGLRGVMCCNDDIRIVMRPAPSGQGPY
jgi:hypothetical protein